MSDELNRAAPAAAQLDAELPPLPSPMVSTRHGTPCYTVGQMMDHARSAVAQYAERIRLLTEERAELQAALDRAERALIRSGFEDLGGQEWKPPIGKSPIFIEVERSQQPAQSIGDDPEFWKPVHQTFYGVEGWRDIEEHAVDEHKSMGFVVRTVYVAAAPSLSGTEEANG